MGASESRQISSSDASAPKTGYHIVRVAANSPAHLAGIEPFFDFCVGLDGVALNPSGGSNGDGSDGDSTGMGAWRRLEEREGTEVVLNIWSSKRQELRGEHEAFILRSSNEEVNAGTMRLTSAFLTLQSSDVPLIPSRSWSSSSSSDPSAQPSLLGLTLRPCNPHLALTSVWHILDILDSSPAESAGLVPFGDYIIGYSAGTLQHEGDFYELVERHEGRPLRLYVYNSDFDHTREVVIVPNREWGGEGLLGCGVGFGLLHRIPRPQDRPKAEAGQDEEDGAEGQGQGQRQHMATSSDSTQNLSSASSRTFNQSMAAGGMPTSSTAPDLASMARSRGSNGMNVSAGTRIPEEEEDEDDDDDDEADVSRTSGVTMTMRADEEEEDD